MKHDLITIVTVTYNAENFLNDTILSIINQDYDNIEYIIIDGASTDDTLDTIKKYENYIDYWVSEDDDGIYDAMNKAIKKANGEWIIFMNAGDTFFSSSTVTDVMKAVDKDTQLIYGNCQIGSRVKKPHDEKGYTNLTSICHQTLFTKTSLMKETPFDTSYRISADHNFILNMFQNNKKFQYLDKSIANYLLDGVSGTETLRLYIEGLNVLFSNKVPEQEIVTSPWYKDLTTHILKKNTDKIYQEDLKTKEKFLNLQNSIGEITNYSIWKNPIKKYKSYKTMLLVYKKIQQSVKGGNS